MLGVGNQSPLKRGWPDDGMSEPKWNEEDVNRERGPGM